MLLDQPASSPSESPINEGAIRETLAKLTQEERRRFGYFVLHPNVTIDASAHGWYPQVQDFFDSTTFQIKESLRSLLDTILREEFAIRTRAT